MAALGPMIHPPADPDLLQSIKSLFASLEARLKDVNESELTEGMGKKITFWRIRFTYQWLLENKENIIPKLLHFKKYLRIPKHGKLKRTVNIGKDIDGRFAAFLEFKSKLADDSKDPNKDENLLKGNHKVGKTSLRLDIYPLKEYINLTKHIKILNNNLPAFLPLHDEVKISRKIARVTRDFGNLLSYGIEGPPSRKVLANITIRQQSIYMPLAKCNLTDALYKHNIPFTKEQKDKILFQILKALKKLHHAGYVHQDLKSENIILFEENGCYRIQIIDYGNTWHHSENDIFAVAARFSDSPEIAHAYSKNNLLKQKAKIEERKALKLPVENEKNLLKFMRYFYNFCSLKESYGQTIANENPEIFDPAINYTCPSKENDMFAFGVLAYELLYKVIINEDPRHKQRIAKNPLLSGTLEPSRKKRLTAKEALKIIEPAPEKALARLALK